MLDLGFISGVAGVPKLAGDAPAGAADGACAISAFAEFRALVDALAGSPAPPPDGALVAVDGEATVLDADGPIAAAVSTPVPDAGKAPEAENAAVTPAITPIVAAARPVAIATAPAPADADVESADGGATEAGTATAMPVADDGPTTAIAAAVVPDRTADAGAQVDSMSLESEPRTTTVHAPSSKVATTDEPLRAAARIEQSPAGSTPKANATSALRAVPVEPRVVPAGDAVPVHPDVEPADVVEAIQTTDTHGRSAHAAPRPAGQAPASTDLPAPTTDSAAVWSKVPTDSAPHQSTAAPARQGGSDGSSSQQSGMGGRARSHADDRPAGSRTSGRIEIHLPTPSTSSGRTWAAAVADAPPVDAGFTGPVAPTPSAPAHAVPIIVHTPATPSAALFSASVAAPALAPAGTPVPEGTAHQIVQALRLQWSNGAGEAHIRLRPEHFGELSIAIRVDRGQVVARLEAEAPAVREWLQANQASLRQGLADQHLTLDRLEVSEPPSESSEFHRRGQERQSDDEAPRRRRSSNPDRGTRFEVIV